MEDRSRRRARLVLIVGILIAALSGGATFLLSSSKTEAVVPVQTTDVLVAARDLPTRTAITAADLKVQKYPVDVAPPAALKDPKDVVGKVVSVPLDQGEPITASKFAPAGAAPFTVFPPNAQPPTGQAIPPGTPDYRAMSISVGDAAAVGGVVQPGDIVDLLFTFQFDPSRFFSGGGDPNRQADFSAKIIIQNMPILARAGGVYTIRTDAQTAERISYIQSAGGSLQFLLRAGQDQRQAATTGATFGDAYKTFGFKVPGKVAP